VRFNARVDTAPGLPGPQSPPRLTLPKLRSGRAILTVACRLRRKQPVQAFLIIREREEFFFQARTRAVTCHVGVKGGGGPPTRYA
jgi:hypothetical protein